MKIKFKRSFLAMFIIICIIFTQSVFAEGSTPITSGKAMEYLDSIMNMIKEKYRGEVTDQQLIEGAIKGMFDTMDPYTQFMTNDEAEDFHNSLDGNFYGIGIIMQQKSDGILVKHVYPNSPAEKAGMNSGDKIVSVDGKNVIGMTTEAVSTLIKGVEGKKVSIGVKRGTGKNIVKIVATVGKVSVSPVEYEIIKDTAYIKLSAFGTNASSELQKALVKIDKANIKKIILDLRNNPGGYVDEAIKIAGNFIPKGLITKLDYKSQELIDVEYHSDLEKLKYKLAVLVNGGSASASEIFSGAVQDREVGTLIGTKTFGKAKVQSLIPILTPEAYAKYEEKLGVRVADAYQLETEFEIKPTKDEILGETRITTGVYITPKGRMIDLQGLVPDLIVPDPTSSTYTDWISIQKLRVVSKPGLNQASTDVFNAEKILKLLGYNVDEPDSFLDKKTYEAIKKFQKAKGGSPYGKLDFKTQKWLNDELEKLRMNADKQYAKAKEVLSK